jgi:hypothetical protein
MPLYMEPIPIDPSMYLSESVLFVICEVCPKMCMSVKQSRPYFSLRGLFGEKDFFDEYINNIRNSFADKGLRTGIFRNKKFNSMMCLWPQKQRDLLSEFSKNFQAIAVIGCQSAVFTVKDSVKSRNIKIYPMMRVEGIANFKSIMEFPALFKLEKPDGEYIVKEKQLYYDNE